MAKNILIMINSGKDQKAKVLAGLNLAVVGKQKHLFDDIKVMFFGPSEQMIAENDKEIMDMIKNFSDLGEKPMACQVVGDSMKITDKLKQVQTLNVTMIGPVLADLVSKGYEVLNF
ncbi:DsrE family protein [Sulfuracidifex tepidarius]|uniref:Uncharacterized protein n=1 Tax=Sulfuracidifex tepidarius TaxID=1294262 RepID=A0A510DSE1_9CREN|nr:DsrE family protein [Sulfuracidifex tepidarius]BBG23075.1 hypothetical protein IC006_0359 [Sulfuracidifex tepidarius]BBG25823.1 hypothetical protein IC007_0328 [Sulfuracidifex tepidarius]